MTTGDLHKKFVKLGRVVFEISEQRDRQTNKLTYSSK